MSWQFQGNMPIYSQLVEYLRQRIASGYYAPGQRLPTVREIAVEAGVNPNTVQRAMAELEREGLVYSQRTAGRFVTEDPDRVKTESTLLARQQIDAFLRSMALLGYSRAQVLAIMQQEEEEHPNGGNL